MKTKKNNLISAIVIVVIALIAAGYLFIQNANRPTISIDGVEFQLKDCASVLTDAGFKITGGETMEAKTWNYMYILEKDGVQYAYLTLYNSSNSEKPLSECYIGEVETHNNIVFEGGYDKVKLNGHAMVGMTMAEAEENFGIKDDGDSAMRVKLGSDSLLLSYYDRDADCFGSAALKCDFGQSYE